MNVCSDDPQTGVVGDSRDPGCERREPGNGIFPDSADRDGIGGLYSFDVGVSQHDDGTHQFGDPDSGDQQHDPWAVKEPFDDDKFDNRADQSTNDQTGDER